MTQHDAMNSVDSNQKRVAKSLAESHMMRAEGGEPPSAPKKSFIRGMITNKKSHKSQKGVPQIIPARIQERTIW